MVSLDLLTVGDLIRYQRAFKEMGLTHIIDGDRKAAISMLSPHYPW